MAHGMLRYVSVGAPIWSMPRNRAGALPYTALYGVHWFVGNNVLLQTVASESTWLNGILLLRPATL